MIPFPNISPDIFSITLFGFTFALRWYALAYIVGILIAWWLILKCLKNSQLWIGKKPVMSPAQLEDLMSWVIMGVIIGGRLGYVLFYKPLYYFEKPLEILMVWQGGMSFHGGLLGVILAGYFFTKKHHLSPIGTADLMALAAPAGLFLGRIANFINGELWGRPTELPWGVPFPGEAAQTCPQVIGICARHPSQLYEAVLEGLVLGLLLLWLAWRREGFKKPGMISGVFFCGYGAARFFVEFFRQPDEHFTSVENPLGLALHINGYGLTMGQILSLPMIAFGLYLLYLSHKKRAT